MSLWQSRRKDWGYPVAVWVDAPASATLIGGAEDG